MLALFVNEIEINATFYSNHLC